LLLRTRTGRATLAVSDMKPANEIHRKMDKESVRFGKDTRPRQGPLNPSRTAAMLKTAPLACERKAT
jgi:hypothetical protein